MVMELEAILEKAKQLNVNLGRMVIVHVDDEPFVLKDTKEQLAPYISEYYAFTEPKEALDYIIANSSKIDFLILDQFITKDMKKIDGYQGTDILKNLYNKKILIPTVIFSGEHAKTDCFSILTALNEAIGISDYMDRIRIERKGNFAPIAYVKKYTGMNELLLNIIGLTAMKRESIDIGYEGFFNSFTQEPIHAGVFYDLAKLAYEKAMILYKEAEKFAEKFVSEVDPTADIIDTETGKPFSQSFLTQCGFKDGIKYTPEEIVGFNESQLALFTHQFTHTFRSIFPKDTGERYNISDYYLSLVEKIKDESPINRDKNLIQYINENPQILYAVNLINNFKNDLAVLGAELVKIRHKLSTRELVLENEWIPLFNYVGVNKVTYSTPELKNSSIISERVSLNFILAELIHNAQKVGRQRGITPEINIGIQEYEFSRLPDTVKSRFKGYSIKNYSKSHAKLPQNVEEAKYIKVSISDNCGGFESDISTYLKKDISGTSSQFGLSTIMSSMQELFCAIDIINNHGKGAIFDIYFVKIQQ